MATILKSSRRPLHHFWKETVDAGKSAVGLYFRPLYWIAKSEALTSRALSVRARTDLDQREIGLLSLLKATICFNQGALIEYSFLVAEKHKAMKSTYLSGEGDVETLQRLTGDLMNYLNRNFFEITFKNFDFIHSYFSRRSVGIPRVCVKGNFKTDNSQTVISIFRDRPVEYNSDTRIEMNSGFFSIKQNGRFFVENNLPEAVLKRHYVNPRLNVQKIRDDAKGGKSLNEISAEWDRYWYDYQPERKGDRSFYKSTLIIPLTLWNNDLSPEFKKLIRIENIERFIFGFLCFDHRDENYFDMEADVNVGYIFADILSVYVFNRMAYTDASSTFAKVREYLDLANAPVEIDKFSMDKIYELIEKVTRIEETTSKPKDTKRNLLVPVDGVLLNSVRPDIEPNAK